MNPMPRPSAHQRLAAALAAFAICFSQLAMAAFAPQAAAPRMVEAMASEGHCAGMDPAAKHVCEKKCEAEPQKHEIPSLAALPPAADPGLRIELAAARSLDHGVVPEAALARSTAPPPTLLFCRFLE